ncbi:MAG: hypothetical protein JWN05_2911 [Arthrobacter sp.]|jgi:hypothetical protein|nr:hypothetical protein [Arthrobacter sp.]
MDPELLRTRAPRLGNPLRRLAVAGMAGAAWLALSAATATADDTPCSAPPDGTGDVVATSSPGPADDLAAPPAPTNPGPVPDDLVPADLEPADLKPAETAWAADAVPDPMPPAADPARSVPAPVPAVPKPAPLADHAPPADAVTAPPPPAADTAPVPDPAAPVPDPTPPAADSPPVPDPGGALPVLTPVNPLPEATVSQPDPPGPGSIAEPAGSALAAPEAHGSPTAAGVVDEAARQQLAQAAGENSRPVYRAGVSFRPPGSAAILTFDTPFTAGILGSGAADPAAPSAPGGGTQTPSGPVGPSPWNEGTGLPAPNALLGSPGSGSGNGQSPTNPAGTAAWIPSLYFCLPTTGDGPIHGPLQHECSAVSADPGSSPD